MHRTSTPVGSPEKTACTGPSGPSSGEAGGPSTGRNRSPDRPFDHLVRDLGSCKAMILRNHGLLAAGATAAEAFHEIYFLERACQAQIQALAGGSALRIPSREVCELTASQFARDDSAGISELAWRAALRLIDDPQSDYRN